jgi:hypothetical protein
MTLLQDHFASIYERTGTRMDPLPGDIVGITIMYTLVWWLLQVELA